MVPETWEPWLLRRAQPAAPWALPTPALQPIDPVALQATIEGARQRNCCCRVPWFFSNSAGRFRLRLRNDRARRHGPAERRYALPGRLEH